MPSETYGLRFPPWFERRAKASAWVQGWDQVFSARRVGGFGTHVKSFDSLYTVPQGGCVERSHGS